eukprot:1158699-Pelagomonas_calceolata.AAC.2
MYTYIPRHMGKRHKHQGMWATDVSIKAWGQEHMDTKVRGQATQTYQSTWAKDINTRAHLGGDTNAASEDPVAVWWMKLVHGRFAQCLQQLISQSLGL